MTRRIHITGASGSGTTTLGAILADHLGLPHLDTDDFYWHRTDPPFREKRPPDERLALIRRAQAGGGWVLSGSLMSWGEPVVEAADLVIFLSVSTPERLARLKAREAARYGPRIAPGGDMETTSRAFLDWAARYDDPGFSGRSRAGHEAWLVHLGRPVLRLDAQLPAPTLLRMILTHLEQAPRA